MVPENILKLLKSSVVEDVLIGVIWCKNNLGVKWCLDNFNFDIKGPCNYPTTINENEENEEYRVIFKDFTVLIGSISIEAYQSEIRYSRSPIIYKEE